MIKATKKSSMISQKKYDLIFFWLIAAIPMSVWAFVFFYIWPASDLVSLSEKRDLQKTIIKLLYFPQLT